MKFDNLIIMLASMIKYSETNKNKRGFNILSADKPGSTIGFVGFYGKIDTVWEIDWENLDEFSRSLFTHANRKELLDSIKKSQIPDSLKQLFMIAEVHEL